jgi:hypothetical protein
MSLQIVSPFQQFFDRDGSPLDNGFVYVGTVNLNPETNPLTIYYDDALTIPAAQPLRTSNGYIVRNGSPARLYTSQEDFSLTVRDKSGVLVFTVADATSLSNLATQLASSSGSSLVGYNQGGVGAVDRTVEDRLQERVSPLDYGAAGDGVTDDSLKFAALEANISGQIVDLLGLSYVVGAYPTGNVYVNGKFIVGSVTYDAAQDRAIISSSEATRDTGGIGSPYVSFSGLTSPAGRTNNQTFVLAGSQGSRSAGPSRAGNYSSIYSLATGNVSANIAARQGFARTPQSFNAAVEECQINGISRNANLGSGFSQLDWFMGVNVGSRRGRSSAENAINGASRTAQCGEGWGATFAVTTTGGVVTNVAVLTGGQDYNTPTLTFADRIGPGSGAVATANVVGGVIVSVAIVSGGSNYSDNSAFVSGNSVWAAVDCVAYDAASLCNANIASEQVTATNKYSANVASLESNATGENSINVASARANASGVLSANIASGFNGNALNVTASGQNSANICAADSTASGALSAVIATNFGEVSDQGSVLIASRRTINASPRSLAGGNASTGSPSTANRKWHIFSDSGNINIAGALTPGVIFTDYAEFFENAQDGVIPVGSLVSLDGRKVQAASDGDLVLGVVSATGAVVAGNSPFHWSKRYLTGEFGEMLYEEILDPDWQPLIRDPSWRPIEDQSPSDCPMIQNPTPQETIRVPMENPDYDATRENVPRSERPDEWTCVGLLGQIHTRLDATVSVGDFVKPSAGGVGTKSDEPTNVRCMEVRSAYDGSKGYAVGLCLVK